jgi:hypothetical protein
VVQSDDRALSMNFLVALILFAVWEGQLMLQCTNSIMIKNEDLGLVVYRCLANDVLAKFHC